MVMRCSICIANERSVYIMMDYRDIKALARRFGREQVLEESAERYGLVWGIVFILFRIKYAIENFTKELIHIKYTKFFYYLYLSRT